MSKAAKQSIFILIFLLLGCLVFAGLTFVEKQKITEQKASVEKRLKKANAFVGEQAGQIKKLQADLGSSKKTNSSLKIKKTNVEKLLRKSESRIKEVKSKMEKSKRRLSSVQKDRDELTSKVQSFNRKIRRLEDDLERAKESVKASVDKEEIVVAKRPPVRPSVERSSSYSYGDSNTDDEYWASVLREKASLEIELENLKDETSEVSIEMVEIKQENADLQIEVDSLVHEKEEIDGEIKYKSDLINNLSLELARTKNDKKFVADRVVKVNEENTILRGQIKQLVSAKSALEKSIVRLTQDKEKMSKQLASTDSLIQSKIDEIWEIKESLDRSFKSSKQPIGTNEIELPPIVVNSGSKAVRFDSGMSDPGFNGKVVSLNKDNNFLIVNIGELSGIRMGDMLSVYRGSKYIARLEVIQVRKDISACDIKDQWSDVKVGDIVR